MLALGRRPASRHDPAPSLWSYRLQRLLLTPGVKGLIRTGAPVLIVFSIAALILADQERRVALREQVDLAWSAVEQRPEFAVRGMEIQGVSPELDTQIRTILGLDFPVSSFHLDLDSLREKLESLGPVESVQLRIGGQGLLHVDITQRIPVAVWRGADGLRLVDQTGAITMVLPEREARADLPLVAGTGARTHIAEALSLIEVAAPIREQVLGLLRVGERRWDILLDRGRRIMLPVEQPLSILETIVVLNETRDILLRDVSLIDYRIPDRPTVRLNDVAVSELRRITAINPEAGQ